MSCNVMDTMTYVVIYYGRCYAICSLACSMPWQMLLSYFWQMLLPWVHKEGMPLRSMISSRGSVIYETAKELARILKPLVRICPHHVQNTKDFINSIEGIQLKPEECIMSYDVNALFTSVPIQPTVNIIKKHQEEDKELHLRTSMTVKHISCLLEFCLKNTYFSFQGRFYERIEGAGMGSPISPIIANLFMEDLEVQAINTSPSPLLCGKDMLMMPSPSSKKPTEAVSWNI